MLSKVNNSFKQLCIMNSLLYLIQNINYFFLTKKIFVESLLVTLIINYLSDKNKKKKNICLVIFS